MAKMIVLATIISLIMVLLVINLVLAVTIPTSSLMTSMPMENCDDVVGGMSVVEGPASTLEVVGGVNNLSLDSTGNSRDVCTDESGNNFGGKKNITLSLWANWSVWTANSRAMVLRDASSAIDWQMAILANKNVELTTSGRVINFMNQSGIVNRWYNIIYLLNDTGEFVYVDGVQNHSNYNTGLTVGGDSNDMFTIFNTIDSGDNPSNMAIDEINIWNESLGTNQIIQIANRSHPNAFYPFSISIPTITPAINDTSPEKNGYVNISATANEDIDTWFFYNNMTFLNESDTVNFNISFINHTQGSNVSFVVCGNDTDGNMGCGELTILIAKTNATVVTSFTNPASPAINGFANVSLNISHRLNTSLDYVNFTIAYPNSTIIVDNQNGTRIAGAFDDTTLWESKSFNITTFGVWKWNVTITDSGGGTKFTSGTFSNFIEVTKDVNLTIQGAYSINTSTDGTLIDLIIKSTSLFNNTDTVSAQRINYNYSFSYPNVSSSFTKVWSDQNTTLIYGSNLTIFWEDDGTGMNITKNTTTGNYTNQTIHINISDAISANDIYVMLYDDDGKEGDWTICGMNNNATDIALGNEEEFNHTDLVNGMNNITLCKNGGFIVNSIGGVETLAWLGLDYFNISAQSQLDVNVRDTTYVNWTTPSLAKETAENEYVLFKVQNELRAVEAESTSGTTWKNEINLSMNNVDLPLSANSLTIIATLEEDATTTSLGLYRYNTSLSAWETISTTLILFDNDGNGAYELVSFNTQKDFTTSERYKLEGTVPSGNGGGPTQGGGGAPSVLTIITEDINVSELVNICGNNICEDKETPFNCRIDCPFIGEEGLGSFICLPRTEGCQWSKAWAINLAIVLILVSIIVIIFLNPKLQKRILK